MTAILRLTDGTTYIDLLHSAGQSGYLLADNGWRPTVAGYKNGGTYQDSPLADGKRLVQAVRDSAIETFTLELRGNSQDDAIRWTQDLRRLLDKAQRYWTGVTQSEPVYLEVRATKETNTRYAIVMQGTMANDDNPMGMPFLQPDCTASMRELTLVVERGEWCANPPGESESVTTTSLQYWRYSAGWSISSSTPTGQMRAAASDDNRTVFVGGNAESYYYDGSWHTVGGLVGAPYNLIKASDGYWYTVTNGAGGGTFRNSGSGSWALHGAAGVTCQTLNHTLCEPYPGFFVLIDDSADLRHSASFGLGGTWGTYTFFSDNWTAVCAGENNNTFYAGDYQGRIFRVTNIRSTPTYQVIYQISPIGYAQVTALDMLGGILYAGLGGATVASRGGILKSNSTFTAMTTIATGLGNVADFMLMANGDIYAVDFGTTLDPATANIRTSVDDGLYFAPYASAKPWWCLGQYGGLPYAGEDGDIYAKDAPITLGGDAETTKFIANKSNLANLTHVYNNHGITYTETFPIATFPQDLFPNPAADDDCVYFGSSTNILDTGPFCSLVFDLATPASAATSYTLVWEYYNSAGNWVTLTVQDGTESFTRLGVSSVHWVQPGDWAAGYVNALPGWWVRVRIDTLVGAFTNPTQQNDDIYTITRPSLDVAADEIRGDLPALARLVLTNVSDRDGVGGNAPNLYSNRLICGLRSYSRGVNFNAYLNASDQQLPYGVSIAAGTNTTFPSVGTDATAAACVTGIKCTYNPTAAAEDMANRVVWTLSSSVARDYYGTFHAFLRGQQSAVTIGNVGVRLVITTGSGGISWTSETKYFTHLTDQQLIDFGRVTLPVGGLFQSDEVADQTTLAIQASATLATDNLYLHDLILIPTDEWAGDFTDSVNTAASAEVMGHVLDVDSLTNPRKTISAKVRNSNGSGFVQALWDTVANGPLVLNSSKQQWLWFLSARSAGAGDDDWYSEPYVCHAVQLSKNERYFSARGDR